MKDYIINEVDGSPSTTNIYNFQKELIVKKARSFDNESKKSIIMINEIGSKVDVFQGDIVKFDFQLNLNEELDNANVSVNSKGDYGTIFPSMSKCLAFFDVHNDITNAEFDTTSETFKKKYFESDGYTPKMHDQYILIQPVMQTLNEEDFFHAFNLVEPTYLLRYAYTGTNSDTNLPEMSVYDPVDKKLVTYTQPENNCLTILERQFKLTGLETKDRHESWYHRIYIPEKIKTLLKNAGKGSSLVFNCATLYDTVFKIGKYIKRYPVLYFNPNYKPRFNSSQIPNENEREFILDFVTYDGSDKDIIKMKDLAIDSTECMISNGSEKQSNAIVCENQNLVSTNSVFYPSKYDFAAISGSQNDMLLEGKNRSNYTLKLPFIIENVISVKCFKAGKHANNRKTFPFNFHSALRKINCVSHSEWLAINDELTRNNTLYFKDNSSEIIVKHYIEHAFPDEKYLSQGDAFIGFQVEYIPQINAMSSNGNGEFKEMINQIDSKLDSKLFGSWIEHYQKQNKAVSMSRKKVIRNYFDIIVPGTIIEDEESGKQWLVNQVQVNTFNNFFQVTYMLSYRVPKRSEVVTASQKIQNKIIEKEKSYDRLINIKENVNIDMYVKNILPPNVSFNSFLNSSKWVFSNFDKKIEVNPIELGYLKIYHNSIPEYKYFKLPLIKTIFGNSILLNMKFVDKKYIGIPNGLVDLSNDSEKEANYKLYADRFNKIESLSIIYSNGSGDIKDEFVYNNTLYESTSPSGVDYVYEHYKYILNDFNEKYPEATEGEYNQKNAEIDLPKIEELLVLKDTYEVPTITYQVEFIGNDSKTTVYDSFVELTALNDLKDNVNLAIELSDYLTITNEEYETTTNSIAVDSSNSTSSINKKTTSISNSVTVDSSNIFTSSTEESENEPTNAYITAESSVSNLASATKVEINLSSYDFNKVVQALINAFRSGIILNQNVNINFTDNTNYSYNVDFVFSWNDIEKKLYLDPPEDSSFGLLRTDQLHFVFSQNADGSFSATNIVNSVAKIELTQNEFYVENAVNTGHFNFNTEFGAQMDDSHAISSFLIKIDKEWLENLLPNENIFLIIDGQKISFKVIIENGNYKLVSNNKDYDYTFELELINGKYVCMQNVNGNHTLKPSSDETVQITKTNLFISINPDIYSSLLQDGLTHEVTITIDGVPISFNVSIVNNNLVLTSEDGEYTFIFNSDGSASIKTNGNHSIDDINWTYSYTVDTINSIVSINFSESFINNLKNNFDRLVENTINITVNDGNIEKAYFKLINGELYLVYKNEKYHINNNQVDINYNEDISNFVVGGTVKYNTTKDTKYINVIDVVFHDESNSIELYLERQIELNCRYVSLVQVVDSDGKINYIKLVSKRVDYCKEKSDRVFLIAKSE